MAFFREVIVPVGGGRIGMAITHSRGETVIVTNHPSFQIAGELWEVRKANDTGGAEVIFFMAWARTPDGHRKRMSYDYASIQDATRAILADPVWWTDAEAQAVAENAAKGRGKSTGR